MDIQKNTISNSTIITNGGDFINGDNNYIIKIIFGVENKSIKIKSIVKQTRNVLNKIQPDIEGVLLQRNLTDLPINDILGAKQFIFIDGEAGSGKSAYAKHILESLSNTCIISFAADQLLKSSLLNTLKNCNIDLGLEEVFNEFPEFPNKLIYVDSFEKLMEGDGEAFRELLYILKENPDIKLMVSCRSYALEILKLNYFEVEQLRNSYTIQVPTLTDQELQYFIDKIPALKSIVENVNLNELLRIPKYLSLANNLISLSDNDFSKIGRVEFKNKLWKNIVGGKSEEKRCNTFMNVAVKRAKNLTLLTSVNEFDLDSVATLKSDGVLYEENQLYAPSHDIFEDWGLIKYIDILYLGSKDIIDFYTKLSNEPAIRRGFRLWTESKIEESSSWIYDFIIDTTNSLQIESYWKDEILTAIIKSDLCLKYFNENEEKLVDNNCELLLRFIHLLKISGKDSNQVPNNIGWDVVISFLYRQLENLASIQIQIVRLLLDWETVLNSGKENRETARLAGLLLYKILKNDDKSDEELNIGNVNSLRNSSTKLLYRLGEYIPDEVRAILESFIKEAREGDLYDIRSEIKYALSYFYSGTLPKFFPDELIILAETVWKKEEDDDYSGTDVNFHFGLINGYDFKYFPHSAYQTFILKLLHSHPLKALDFIINFTNYCSDKYIASDFLKESRFMTTADDITDVEILYEDEKYQMKGSNYLWSINRGGQITVPYLLQSVVVSLEKYLYDLGKIESENVNTILQTFFDKIYKNSDNVILLSVLASITMAYPKKVGDKFLPLLSAKLFFDWDRNRWLNDYTKNSFFGFGSGDAIGELCDKERLEALNWEHRKKYHKGLTGFVLQYQILYGNLNGKLFKMIDYLEKSNSEEDFFLLKLLAEIDIRKQIIEQIEYEGQKVIQIGPDYTSDTSLEIEMKKNEDAQKIYDESSKYHLWISQTYKNPEENKESYEFWQESLNYHQNESHDHSEIEYFKINIFPVGTLASLGLSLFSDQLNDGEFSFCVETILNMAEDFYDDKKNQDDFSFESIMPKVSVYDYDSVYSTLPKLILHKNRLTEEQFGKAKLLIFLFLRDLHIKGEHHMKAFYSSFRKYVWENDYQFAYNCFIGIIRYAEFFKKYGRNLRFSEDQLQSIQNEEMKILDFVDDNEMVYELSNLSYSKYSYFDLDKALGIFAVDKDYDFSFDFINSMFEAQYESYGSTNREYSSEYYYEIELTIRHTLVAYLLHNCTPKNETFFQNIIGLDSKTIGYDRTKFIKKIIEDLYYKIDRHSEDVSMKKSFWKYWDRLFLQVKDSKHFLLQEFLFYGRWWRPEADNWSILEEVEISQKYLDMLSRLSFANTDAFLQLFSGIGFQSLMPQGVTVLVKCLINDNINLLEGNNYYYGERLIMKVFKDKFKLIKESKKRLADFLEFLDIMIISGSSKAYYIRENLILYKVG